MSERNLFAESATIPAFNNCSWEPSISDLSKHLR
jgi:hypothetical protein